MDLHTPGVHIREVDSGSRPIASVATSVAGFLGLFQHQAVVDAVAIQATDGVNQLTGKVVPQLVDTQGAINPANTAGAVSALTTAFRLRRSGVKNLRRLLELNGHKPTLARGEAGRIRITVGQTAVEADGNVVDVEGRVISSSERAVEEMLLAVHAAFPLDRPQPRSAKELLEVYGYSFQSARGTSLTGEYSVPPFAVHNPTELFRWLQSYFAQYLVATRSVQDLVGRRIENPEEAADAVFEALTGAGGLGPEFQGWLSQPTMVHFVTAVQGFYDNGGGKAYLYLMGAADPDVSIRENQADKLGLYAFDDCDDIALALAPGLGAHQQRELLEHCEARKDRFAILDGPLVSTGELDPPASERGYGAMFVPWLKVARPAWLLGDPPSAEVDGLLRRKLIKAERHEIHVPPSGHVAGMFARVDAGRGVHKAPANEPLMGITGLSQTINRLEQGRYHDRGVNVIRDFPTGVRVWGARTLAAGSDPQWKHVNVRRLFVMVEQSIRQGMQWAVFEPNDAFLWSRLKRDVKAYLLRVWQSGALVGATPEQAFYIRCDAETNPRYLIEAGQVNVQIGLSPVRPAEFVVFSIGQWDGGSLVEE